MGFVVRMTLAMPRPEPTRTAVLGRLPALVRPQAVGHVRAVTEDLTKGDRVNNRLRRPLPGVRQQRMRGVPGCGADRNPVAVRRESTDPAPERDRVRADGFDQRAVERWAQRHDHRTAEHLGRGNLGSLHTEQRGP